MKSPDSPSLCILGMMVNLKRCKKKKKRQDLECKAKVAGANIELPVSAKLGIAPNKKATR